MKKNIALIVAAGIGTRFGNNEIPKQYQPLGNSTILNHSINCFSEHADISNVFTVINNSHKSLYDDTTIKHIKLHKPIIGGDTRQESVYNGLKAIADLNPDNVLIHDAARPLITRDIISRTCEELKDYQAVLPAIPVVDTLKRTTKNREVINTVERNNLWQAQTPQGFDFKTIYNAHKKYKLENLTDDIALVEKNGITAKIIMGHQHNFKITTIDDFTLASAIISNNMEQIAPDIRTGFGYDVHQLVKGNNIRLCGIDIACDYALSGHSDADVALHALTDAILGTIGAEDIGHHFPPTDKKWKNADSTQFLQYALKLLKQQNGIVNHIDITIVCETPKIAPYREEMRKLLAKIMFLSDNRVSIKATTTEQLGFTGRKEGIAVNAIATVIIR